MRCVIFTQILFLQVFRDQNNGSQPSQAIFSALSSMAFSSLYSIDTRRNIFISASPTISSFLHIYTYGTFCVSRQPDNFALMPYSSSHPRLPEYGRSKCFIFLLEKSLTEADNTILPKVLSADIPDYYSILSGSNHPYARNRDSKPVSKFGSVFSVVEMALIQSV